MKSFKSQTSTWSKRKQTEFDVYFLRKLSLYSLSPAVLPSFFIILQMNPCCRHNGRTPETPLKSMSACGYAFLYIRANHHLLQFSVGQHPACGKYLMYNLFYSPFCSPILCTVVLPRSSTAASLQCQRESVWKFFPLALWLRLETPLLCWRRHIAWL